MFMSDVSNRTYITLDGFIQVHKYGYLYFVIMLAAYILIILFNSSIVFVIWTTKSLHEPMYVFIAALLVNSVLFSTVIYPKLLIDFLSERQTISSSACYLQCHFFYSFTGSEFFLLVAMSYDRYVSICKPLQYPTIMRRTTVISLLVLAWLFPAVQFIGLTILNARRKLCSLSLRGIFCNNAVVKLPCDLPIAVFRYSLVTIINLAVLPMFFIFFTYAKILLIAFHSSGEMHKKVAETCLPHLLVFMSFCCLLSFDAITVRLESDLPKSAGFAINLQVAFYHPILNPIMYGLKMKEIHKHLKRMIFRDNKFIK